MNDITKDSIRRFLARFGVRLLYEVTYKFEYNRENFQDALKYPAPVIFDVGANIGQSAIWFSKSFPTASIHAFEPVPAVFKRLEREVSGNPRIRPLKLACGKTDGVFYIPKIDDELIQSVQVFSNDEKLPEGDEVVVTTIDRYCAAHSISSIQILKTDTEGYDLDVLRGSTEMLKAGKVGYVLSEATIARDDKQHTNLFDLVEYLKPFGFTLVSFYDLRHHQADGKIYYLNALFQKDASS